MDGSRAFPNCHLWDMAQHILGMTISGQIGRGYLIQPATSTSLARICHPLNQEGTPSLSPGTNRGERGQAVGVRLRRLGRERQTAVIVVTDDERIIEGFDRVYHMTDGLITNDI